MIDPIHTPCKDCTFAVYENKTQTECALGYLDIYKSNKDLQVLEVYDNEKEFFVINKKKCPGYREPKWFDKISEPTETLQDKINAFHKYNKIGYLLVINLLVISKSEFIDLCEQISALDILPNKIIFVRYPPSNSNDTFPYEYLKDSIDKHLPKTAWKIQTVVDPTTPYEFMLQNIVSVNKRHRFVISVNGFNTDIGTIIDRANSVVTKDLGSFVIISNKDKTCFIFSSVVYRYSMFMEGKNILLEENNYQII